MRHRRVEDRALAQDAGGRCFTLAPLAWSNSSGVRRTIVEVVTPLPAETASASAAAAGLSGRSAITWASFSPNVMWNESTFPPALFAAARSGATTPSGNEVPSIAEAFGRAFHLDSRVANWYLHHSIFKVELRGGM